MPPRSGSTLLRVTIVATLVWLGLHAATPIHADALHAPAAQSGGDPLVFAFYYTWFDENTWSYEQLSDLPAEPYVSRDRGVMGRHIDQAKAAGIDAFLVAWYGPTGEFNQTEPNLAALLEEAAARQFKIGILFESDSPFLGSPGAISGALRHALSVHANHPAFLRVDGRPVIFFWRPTIYGVESWRAIRNEADPGYSSIWIAEGVNTGYLAVFDGHHLYSNTWNPPSDLTYTNQKFANLVQQARQSYGTHKFWVATVMPGYNDVRIRPNGGFAKDREGGAYYERSWQAAIAGQPDWVVVTSFNEWPEGTYIEPSVAYGGHYLGLTAAWSGQFKSRGSQPLAQPPAMADAVISAAAQAPAPQPTPLPTPSPTPYPEPERPTAFVQASLLNLRAGPGTEAYAIVGQVAADVAVPIVGQNGEGNWWQVQVDDQLAWISADFVHAAGPLEQVPTIAPLIADTVGIDNDTASPETVTAAGVDEMAAKDTITIEPILKPTSTPAAATAVTTTLLVTSTGVTLNDNMTNTGENMVQGLPSVMMPTPSPVASPITSPATEGAEAVPSTYQPRLSRNP